MRFIRSTKLLGPRRVHARGAIVDPFQAEQHLVRMRLRTPAELAAVVGEDGADRHAEGFVERQDALVEQITRAVIGILEV